MIMQRIRAIQAEQPADFHQWLKNLQHVRFGRIEKRLEEKAARQILNAIEHSTGSVFSEHEIADFARGAEELDLVNSGLEETMCTAYDQIRRIKESFGGRATLRDAAFVSAIDKIVLSYRDLGIFP